ncbi:hypothetical protein GCM10010371_36530 [Streptomyces subrutilus]|uniref:Uncharacterized protein n=1 Tax=Streptomyces subrutilus TaxID=36818 RepID=A0A5P2UNT3_9ACTN|nr:hypothetical protein [Streptomyces subrutilus]QEU80773.1 hypothetical protein CP968_23030 [Streptomyces subrutilus]GGZ73504.1 hypothetical protein GCM10010371_36530 [Streptomyces subrutilus]
MTSRHAPPTSPGATRCQDVPVPATSRLSTEQLHGRACVACGEPLPAARVHRGVALVHDGGYALDFDVYSCPPSDGGAA